MAFIYPNIILEPWYIFIGNREGSIRETICPLHIILTPGPWGRSHYSGMSTASGITLICITLSNLSVLLCTY